jgi:hypothetical protein
VDKTEPEDTSIPRLAVGIWLATASQIAPSHTLPLLPLHKKTSFSLFAFHAHLQQPLIVAPVISGLPKPVNTLFQESALILHLALSCG